MPRNPKDRCDISWDVRYGTASGVLGNLPTYNRFKCIDDTINLTAINLSFPWVKKVHFNHYNLECPYSNEASLHYVRNIDVNSPDYWKLNILVIERSNHTATGGMMVKYHRGTAHGWLCVDPSCPYFINNGKPYFHI